MNRRDARRLAWFQFGLTLAATAVGLLLLALTWSAPAPAGWGFRGFTSLFALSFSLTGVLVATRRPNNAVAILNALIALAGAVLIVCACAASIALVLRVRQAHGDERQQLKWFASAIAVLAVAIPLGSHDQSFGFKLGELALIVAIAAVPVATSVAILRYHLYDIDRLINRTLVYALLTLGLGFTYWSSVVGEVLAVVRQTIQPRRASLWLRPLDRES